MQRIENGNAENSAVETLNQFDRSIDQQRVREKKKKIYVKQKKLVDQI